ncbi:MAG: hypothetical protein RR521_12890, partial [Clostridia bacterium]
IDSIKGVFVGIWDAIKKVFGINSPSTVAAEAGGFILDGLLSGFESAITATCDAVKRIFGKIWDAIKSIFGFGGESEESKEAKDAGKDIMGGIKDGITGSEGDLESAVKSAAQKALTKFKSEFGVESGNSTITKPYGTALAGGVNDGLNATTEASFSGGATAMFNAVAAAVNTAFGVSATGFLGTGGNSSKKFEEVGKAICKAVADGITANNNNTEALKTAMINVANAAYTAAVEQMAGGITGGTETVNAAVDEVCKAALAAAAELLTKTAGTELGSTWMEGARLGIASKRLILTSTSQQTAKAAQDAAKNTLNGASGQQIGTSFALGIRTGISRQAGSVRSAASGLGNSALSALWGAVGSGGSRFNIIGDAIAEGVARGIRNGSSKITSAARIAAQGAYNAAKRELGIASPSKKMAEIGENYTEGFAEGIERSMARVMTSARVLSSRASRETAAGGTPILSAPQGAEIDYERLGDAVADSFIKKGIDRTVITMDRREVGRTVERDVSRASYERAGQSAKGRAARMVLV